MKVVAEQVKLDPAAFGDGGGSAGKAAGLLPLESQQGDLVQGMLHWQDFFIITKADALRAQKEADAGSRRRAPALARFGPLQNHSRTLLPALQAQGGGRLLEMLQQKPSYFLSLLGLTSFTAYFGFFDVGLRSLDTRRAR